MRGVSLAVMLLAGCGAKEPGLPVRATRTWPVPPVGATQPAPRSVVAGLNGEWVVLDNAGRVLVYGADGTVRRQWNMPETSVGKPEGVCVLRDGHVVVCDTHNHRVIEFDTNGQEARRFGEEGRGPGEFIYPVAVTVDAVDHLYVAEYGSNDRVQKFARDGTWLTSFGAFGTQAGAFQRPSGLVWHAGKVYVADAFNNRVQVFTDGGAYERTFEGLALKFPYDLRLGGDGTLYVVEYGAGRVSRVSLAGTLLGRYGGPGGGAGQFATPWGLGVAGKQIVVADTGNRRLVQLELE